MILLGGTMLIASVLPGFGGSEATAQTVSGQVAYEIAPDVFDVTDTAIWDGKRTLQGLWVAHPDARSAQRVRIVSVETGTEVDGALFRRDSSLAGPPVLISSEAATALGMEPGYPIDIRIIAVRAVDVAASQPVARETAPVTPPPDTETATPIVVAPIPEPVADPVKDKPTTETAAPTPPVSPPAAPVVAAKPPAPAPVPAPTPAITNKNEAMPPARPFVAAGVYRDKGNADRMIAALRADGFAATGAEVRLGSGPATRVTAGPFSDTATRDRALARIRMLGVPDAYAFAR